MNSLDFEGRPVPIVAGDTIASALHRAGVRVFSRSFKYHRPRGLYCLSGDCPNCLLTVDAEPAVRACMTPACARQRVVRENGWPSADQDALALLWRLRVLLPVGFYYKALGRPLWLWPRLEPLVRSAAGLGNVPSNGAEVLHRRAQHLHTDLLVAGGGSAGTEAAFAAAQAGERVLLADEGELAEERAALLAQSGVHILERSTVVGIYEGPLVPVAAPQLLYLVHPNRVLVAAGAVEQHPVFRGNDLPGVWLGRGAAKLAQKHGLVPGRRVVLAGATPEVIDHADALLGAGAQLEAVLVPDTFRSELSSEAPAAIDGAILAAEGRGRVQRVIARIDGRTRRISCDALVVSDGLVPRDGLARQGSGLPVGVVGDAALESPLPAMAEEGIVCTCEDVTVADLEHAWAEGFRSTELLKRYTTAAMGPCQGALCGPHVRAFVIAHGGQGAKSASTTARPPVRPLRLEEAAAGVHLAIEQRTALHERHLQLGANMEWAGVWKRPTSYGDWLDEYWAVRRAVSVMDVGTLGKFIVAGLDAAELLERVYPCRVGDLVPGQLRYAVLLNEAGHVVDDGIIASLETGRFYLTFTSSGAEQAEAWLLDWAETFGLDVHIANQTAAFGAINVVGPRSRELLGRLTGDALDSASFPYPSLRRIRVADVECIALRLGFTGELGFELHHASGQSVHLWHALLEAGRDLDMLAHGLAALRLLRLEKGHIIIGQDTDFDSTPAKLGLDYAVSMDKPFFVGRSELARLSRVTSPSRLAQLVFDGEAPPEGTPIRAQQRHLGHLTSAGTSPVLGHGIALAWVHTDEDGRLPAHVQAGDAVARIVEGGFYDPQGKRLRA